MRGHHFLQRHMNCVRNQLSILGKCLPLEWSTCCGIRRKIIGKVDICESPIFGGQRVLQKQKIASD